MSSEMTKQRTKNAIPIQHKIKYGNMNGCRFLWIPYAQSADTITLTSPNANEPAPLLKPLIVVRTPEKIPR